MKTDSPKDIIDGRMLFEKYENSESIKDRARFFIDATDILNDYISYHSESSHKKLANNLKITYTLHLLRDLPNLFLDDDIWLWFEFIFALKAVENERMAICQEELKLDQNYWEFQKAFEEVFFEMVG